MKGDYSRPGVMPSRYLKEIDLPSAYLVYAVGRRLRGSYNLRRAQAENSHSEMEGFFWWVWAQRLDPEWILTSLMKVLDLLATRQASDFLLLEPLAGYSQRYPLLSARCLRKLVQSPQQEYAAMGNENELKSILRNAINSGNAEAKGLCEEIQDALLRMGRSQFMDLGYTHLQAGDWSTP
jgi:hypothetical protein